MKTLEAVVRSAVAAQGRGFVRLSRDADWLWTSDVTRHAACPEIEKVFGDAGFLCRRNENGLLGIDPVPRHWSGALESDGPPSLPEEEALHAAYGLWQIAFRHPFGPPERLPAPTRALMKAMLTGEEAVLRLIPELLEASAECLRRGQAPPWGLGDLLGSWLTQRMKGEPE